MYIRNPQDFEKIIASKKSILFEAYKIDPRKRKLIIAISAKKENKEEDVVVEASEDNITEFLKAIEENWDKIPSYQKPRVRVLIKEVKEKL
ncbi:hypothetical protein AciM339_1494 [Aciduliprofundum sp. MAR08-339]|uniref:hypothetical protein n=1 Tax=Aciduliprofundum sp. (strain MAR08-339) TaxID=673860 RepID=UPI0002A498BF|nr:hypothetical protein AciM339_1494 [Aciduliprofundum sp. MAR08-339]